MHRDLLRHLLRALARTNDAPADLRRRAITRATVLLATAGLVGPTIRTASAQAAKPRFVAEPFALGVASGYPRADGVSLWTRLAPAPLAEDAGMTPENVELRWQVAHDEAFTKIAREGRAIAYPETAHAVHVDVDGLDAARWYHYRFIAGDAMSATGRTRTAGASGKLRFAIGSCQHYEHGYFSAHRHLAEESLDLMLFLGDYLYESTWGDGFVRRHLGAEATTLADYRRWYGQYKSDEDLKRLHASVPFALCWDDHEVDNDYAADQSEHLDPGFLTRRAAAYRAYFEHQPLPMRMLGSNGAITMYDRVTYGDLAQFHLLDDRQYRTPQACPDPLKGGGSRTLPDCDAVDDEARTMLGAAQERWLSQGLRASTSRWNFIAQQTLVATMDFDPDAPNSIWTDGWDGYTRSRAKLLDDASRTSNPVALGGDIHAACVADVKRGDETVMAEFVTTSLAAQGWPAETFNKHASYNPHMHLLDAKSRGYTVFELTPARLAAQVRAISDEKARDATVATRASFDVLDGRRGIA